MRKDFEGEIRALKYKVDMLEQERDYYRERYTMETGRVSGNHCGFCVHNANSTIVHSLVYSVGTICDLEIPCKDFERRKSAE